MAGITLQGVSKVFAGGHAAVRDLSLHIPHGEFFVLLGPSGCGKSTTLRLVAGLEEPTAGDILLDGAPVTRLPPGRRNLAMVFQNYALFPHLTVAGNLEFGLRVRGVSKARRGRAVAEAAEKLGLAGMLGKKPRELSGGQRQRVALGRALVRQPVAFLLDEPLSNLDAALRTGLRREILRLHQNLGATMVYVTHDQVEAMTLGQRIGVMDAGRLVQVGAPDELYAAPADAFVAAFFGTPAMNLLPAGFARKCLGVELPGGCRVGFRPGSLVVNPVAGTAPAAGGAPAPDSVSGGGAGVRVDAYRFAAGVDLRERTGEQDVLHLKAANWRLQAVVPRGRWDVGAGVSLVLPVEECHWFDAAGKRMPAPGPEIS